MTSTIKRAIISVAVAAVIYLVGPFVIRCHDLGYDVYVQAILLLTAVIGGGCYWIGSKE